jgi:subtilisin family serine protease
MSLHEVSMGGEDWSRPMRSGRLDPLGLIQITELMDITRGRSATIIGLLDGPVAIDHPDLTSEHIRYVSVGHANKCAQIGSSACAHGTFVAGILSARRGAQAAAICPGCTLLVRPIFVETTSGSSRRLPSTTPAALATAIIECIDAGARILNLSVGLAEPSCRGERELEDALGYAVSRGVVVIAAAGNQGTVASSAITRHPGVIPIVACDLQGQPMPESNLGGSVGRRGLCAPGAEIISLGTNGQPSTFGGTRAAAPFVTGAIALLCRNFRPHQQLK